MKESSAILSTLRKAIDRCDPDGVEDALNQAFGAGLTTDLIPTLIELVELPWHYRHEDVVSALQELKPPSAVRALRRAAVVTHAYLDYDEFFGLARKCTWALADIGTEDAKAALNDLAATENKIIAGYARKRLENWEQERHRKGA